MSVNLPASDLEAIIIQRINDAGGVIPFSRFMHAALYEPGLGYYESAKVFGREGDFITGAELGPWLALGFADLIEWGWHELGSPGSWYMVEQGGGNGRLMVEVVRLLNGRGVATPHIIAIEASAWMRERQQQFYAKQEIAVRSVATVEEAGQLDDCLMFCNELPDAFPVNCFSWQNGRAVDRGVGHSEGGFVWKDGLPLMGMPEVDERLKASWPEGYISEYNPALAPWLASVAGMIRRGFMFCVDYGYSQQEYYRPQRIEGTLMGHRGHQVVYDILERPGSCDITAHVDFSAMRRLGEAAGLRTSCFMTQGGWLAQSPSVHAYIESLAVAGGTESMQRLAEAKQMLMPMGMGESFKLLIQGRGTTDLNPPYLKQFNRIGDLAGSGASA